MKHRRFEKFEFCIIDFSMRISIFILFVRSICILVQCDNLFTSRTTTDFNAVKISNEIWDKYFKINGFAINLNTTSYKIICVLTIDYVLVKYYK